MKSWVASRKTSGAVIAGLIGLWPFIAAQACGPFFESDVFVDVKTPDDIGAFARGKLGILQTGYDSDEYAIAYRYLNGGKLSEKEVAAIDRQTGPMVVQDWRKMTPEQIEAAREAERKAREEAQPAGMWLQTRASYSTEVAQAKEPSFPVNYEGDIVFDPDYLNCPNAAFENAVMTLKKRAGVWGGQSRWVADWIHGQDMVFSNCDGKSLGTPTTAPADGPVLLRADREYQIASAMFYAKQFDEAAQRFEAIASEKDSPWSGWGEYLAARSTVRKAFAMGKKTDAWSGDVASFDMGTMRKAQTMLEGLLAERNPIPSREAVMSELNFVRIRTDPEKRAGEICAALAGPGPDANFAQDLKDLSYVLMKNIEVKDQPPLLKWIAAWRGATAADDAFATWQQSHAMPWLVMAMVKADAPDAMAPQLLTEAEKIKPGMAAYDTVFYHRVRLLIGRDRADDARGLLDQALPTLRAAKPGSTLNALLRERLAVARNFDEFLEYAPRADFRSYPWGVDGNSTACSQQSPKIGNSTECARDKSIVAFDTDAVDVLNQKTPLNLLVEAAGSAKLPTNLREDVALAAWTRSVLIEDAATAGKLVPMLPKAMGQRASSGVGFPASMTILRNPGLRPFVEVGASRLSDFSSLDSYRDNWWCSKWQRQDVTDEWKAVRLPSPAFFSAEQSAQAKGELERLQKLPGAAVLVGQRVIDYAKEHPEDSAVPEALALTVRATRYGCSDWAADSDEGKKNSAVSKAAFQLLHARYPKSPWAAKTKYYY